MLLLEAPKQKKPVFYKFDRYPGDRIYAIALSIYFYQLKKYNDSNIPQ